LLQTAQLLLDVRVDEPDAIDRKCDVVFAVRRADAPSVPFLPGGRCRLEI
jgi:hypothetical protein